MTPLELKLLRKRYHLTQMELGAALSPPVSRLTIYNWESGKFAMPVDIEQRLAKANLDVPVSTKETAKQERDRLAYERHLIDHWRGIYRATRAWPQYNNHAKAMALFASQGHVIPPCTYAALVADFPDILSDPHGDHAMTREQSAAALNLKQS